MSTRLSIFDVSSLLYAGHCVRNYSFNTDYGGAVDKSVEGVPIGGVRYALKYIFNSIERREDVLLVFDSKTDKQTLFTDYKGNRASNPAILVQQAILLDIAKGLKLPLLKIDNYEADDLIATFIRKYRKKFISIAIYTGDADIYSNIIDKDITVVGTASIYPSVTMYNYTELVKKDAKIQYNAILPYFAIYGKPSNNVPAFDSGENCLKAYSAFLHYVIDQKIPQGLYSQQAVFAKWLFWELETNASGLTEEQIGKLAERIEYVYPRIYEGSLDIKFIDKDELSTDDLIFYLKAVNLSTLLLNFDLVAAANAPMTPEMRAFIKGYKGIYVTGEFAVDEDTSPDDSLFSGDTTDFFVDEGDF